MKIILALILAMMGTSAAVAGTARQLYPVEQNVVQQKIAQLTGGTKAELSYCSLTAEPFAITCDLSVKPAGDQGEPSELKGEVIFDVVGFKERRVTEVAIKSLVLHSEQK